MRADVATEEAVLNTLKTFMSCYESRDVEGVMRTVAPDADVVMFGTGADEKRVGPAQVRAQVERDLAQTDSIALRLGWYVVSSAGSVAWVSADVAFEGSVGGQQFTIPGRATAVFENRGDSWLLVNSHFSAPYAGQEEGQSIPS